MAQGCCGLAASSQAGHVLVWTASTGHSKSSKPADRHSVATATERVLRARTRATGRFPCVQDPENPAKLYNHDNQYLHYEDDWYIVKSVPEEYAAALAYLLRAACACRGRWFDPLSFVSVLCNGSSGRSAFEVCVHHAQPAVSVRTCRCHTGMSSSTTRGTMMRGEATEAQPSTLDLRRYRSSTYQSSVKRPRCVHRTRYNAMSRGQPRGMRAMRPCLCAVVLPLARGCIAAPHRHYLHCKCPRAPTCCTPHARSPRFSCCAAVLPPLPRSIPAGAAESRPRVGRLHDHGQLVQGAPEEAGL